MLLYGCAYVCVCVCRSIHYSIDSKWMFTFMEVNVSVSHHLNNRINVFSRGSCGKSITYAIYIWRIINHIRCKHELPFFSISPVSSHYFHHFSQKFICSTSLEIIISIICETAFLKREKERQRKSEKKTTVVLQKRYIPNSIWFSMFLWITV